MLFFAVCLVVIALVVGYQLRFVRRERTIAAVTWEDLVGQLEQLDTAGLKEISDCYLHPGKSQLRFEPGMMWDTVGGIAGIQKLSCNSQVMLNLAMYAERWNDTNGRVLSEIMRRDALRIRASVQQIEFAMLSRHGLVYLGLELQEAIASYCLMRARLLGMYEECHSGLLPLLVAAL